jgi:ParB family chromosome partitioning protein
MTKPKAKGLGRGLDALLGNPDPVAPVTSAGDAPPQRLPLNRLQAGRYQPRTRMDEGSIQELAASIRQHGLMQPIVVRALPAEPGDGRPTRYEIIAGERRYRAAKLAELAEVPVVVREADDESALSLALIENIQREDLNPLEEAQGIRRLIEEFGYSHEQAAEAIGRSRSATSNLLRLLNLAEPVQAMLMSGDLDMGHARALLAVDRAKQIMLAQEIVDRGLSVRETEKRVAQETEGGTRRTSSRGREPSRDRDLERLETRIADRLGTKVTLSANPRGAGRLTISFSSMEQFEGLAAALNLTDLLRED